MGQNQDKRSALTPQRVLAFVQGDRATAKLAGIKKHGGKGLHLAIIRVDTVLPPLIDDASEFLPERIEADLVLDFLAHPDLSHDLAALCTAQFIPIVASGKKTVHPAVLAPPT